MTQRVFATGVTGVTDVTAYLYHALNPLGIVNPFHVILGLLLTFGVGYLSAEESARPEETSQTERCISNVSEQRRFDSDITQDTILGDNLVAEVDSKGTKQLNRKGLRISGDSVQTNVLAIISFICTPFGMLSGAMLFFDLPIGFLLGLSFISLLSVPLAIILGIIALKQIGRREEKGRGFAIAGIIIGGLLLLIAAIRAVKYSIED